RGDQESELAIAERADVDENVAEAEVERAAERVASERNRPVARVASVLAGQQPDREYAATREQLELMLRLFRARRLAIELAIVAAHAAHLALGVAGVGEVERRERLELVSTFAALSTRGGTRPCAPGTRD